MATETSKYYQRNRDKWLLENGPCQKCGSWDNLEVDHIDPSTKDPLVGYPCPQSFWTWSPERRAVELAKCQVLCTNCHKIKTSEEWHKDFCVNGHPMTPENTWIPPAKPTQRRCKTCKNMQRWGPTGRYGLGVGVRPSWLKKDRRVQS